MELSYITGFFSPSYKPLLRLLNASLVANGLPHAEFSHIPQEFFDRSWDDCKWCKSRPCKFQFHHGASIKIDMLLEAVQENEGGVVLFMDCDAIVLPGFGQMIREWLSEPKDSWDAIFSAEGATSTDIWPSNVNIGFCLLQCNNLCISFLEDCAHAMRQHSDTWDQNEVNKLLVKSPNLKFRVVLQDQLYLYHLHGPFAVPYKEECLSRIFSQYYEDVPT
ncbi:hypothetical protein KAR91_40035 [Candidatus Pacearchaeota archaeon]|nr:hypothetical protein [Candidatus Pacearchaeota archaeon]